MSQLLSVKYTDARADPSVTGTSARCHPISNACKRVRRADPSEWASRHASTPARTPLPSIAVPTKADPGRHPCRRARQAGKRKKLRNFFRSLRAVGETRTHTGQRPLPPQSSVSTISPLPQICLPNFRLGLQIYARIFNLQNFFNIFSHTYIQYALCFKKVFLSLHPHPREGCITFISNFLKQIHNGC